MIKKTKIFIGVGIITLSVALFIGYSSFASSNYPTKEYSVQQSVINTFDISTKDYKPLFTRDVFDNATETVSSNDIKTESSEIRGKIVNAISILTDDGDLKVGDFQPMIFLKGNDEVLIGIKHPDETITLVEFDISKEKPVKGEKQVKAISK